MPRTVFYRHAIANLRWQKLAGIKIRAVKGSSFVDDWRLNKLIEKSNSQFSVLNNDPIPLLWTA